MLKELVKHHKKPELYAASTSKFWDDEHISKGMLESHLDPDWGASRPHAFMDKSVEWIGEIAPVKDYERLLDLGCGPGLYAERLVDEGYKITGIDFSKRSIAYATERAKERNHNIEYIYKNYLEIDYKDEFDIITLIYCDYGALPTPQREILLKKIYEGLKEGGRFIFDVFTPKRYEGKEEGNQWYIEEGGGFWKPDTYLCLESHYIYDGNIRLDQYIITDINENTDVVRVWDHYFTRDSIIHEIEKVGFRPLEIYSDVAGTPYNENSKTICVVATK